MVYHQILFKTFAKFCSHNNDKNVIDEKNITSWKLPFIVQQMLKKKFHKTNKQMN